MKKLALFAVIITSVILFSGCSMSNQNSSATGNILKSADGGKTWEPKVKVDDKKSIASVNVLSMAINLGDSKVIYIGTREDGIFVTKNGGENWEKINFPPTKVYGLVIDHSNVKKIYATGVWQGRGKIYKTENEGGDWEEIYTEPADGTIVISLAINPFDNSVLYAGTSKGAVFKTVDGGKTWHNLSKANGPVIGIVFDSIDGNTAYFTVMERGILRTKDGGSSFDDLEKNIRGDKLIRNSRTFSIATDPLQSGVVYAGLDEGIMRSSDFGETWNLINTLEPSREFPVRAIAINPENSKEIIYSAAQAVYKSIDGGVQWSTSQLQSKNVVNVIQYDPSDPAIVYLGLKKAD